MQQRHIAAIGVLSTIVLAGCATSSSPSTLTGGIDENYDAAGGYSPTPDSGAEGDSSPASLNADTGSASLNDGDAGGAASNQSDADAAPPSEADATSPPTTPGDASGPPQGQPDTGNPSHHDAGGSSQGDSSTTSDSAPVDAGSAADTGAPPSGTVGGVPGAQAGPGAAIGSCQIFPPDNPWNVEVDGANVPVIHTYDSSIPQTTKLHPDWGDYSTNHYGIPYNVVPATQPDLDVDFSVSASESDPGPGGWIGANPNTTGSDHGVTAWPFFAGMKIEGDPGPGGTPGNLPNDQHGLVLQQGANGCTSYEAWNCAVVSSAPFPCANGAVFNLTSNALRPAGWTSADAAGLSVLAGLVKLAEVQGGAINHAIRLTLSKTQNGYIPPATHAAGSEPLGSAYPPMGLRLRMKASVSTTGYTAASQVIMAALKKYGFILADNGSNWYFTGDSDDGWDATAPDGQDTLINEISTDFGKLNGSDFEVIFSGDPVATGL